MKKIKNIKIELSEKERQEIKNVFTLIENIMETMDNEGIETLWSEYEKELHDCLQTKDLQETLDTLEILDCFELSMREEFEN